MSNKCENCIHYDLCVELMAHANNEEKDFIKEILSESGGCADHYKDKSLCVEVVRCKDCEHWKDTSFDTVTEKHWGECRKPLGDYRYCETSENDYCSYAERKLEELGV